MKMRVFCAFAVAVCLAVAQGRVQEQQPGQGAPGSKAAAAADNPYAELTKSKDSKTKGLAERYGNLIKYQEWTTASGKAPIAKYLSHDPDLKHVKLGVGVGTGKDRAVKEFNVSMESLSKTSQSRLKQIDALQKKLDELASAEPKNGEAGAA